MRRGREIRGSCLKFIERADPTARDLSLDALRSRDALTSPSLDEIENSIWT